MSADAGVRTILERLADTGPAIVRYALVAPDPDGDRLAAGPLGWTSPPIIVGEEADGTTLEVLGHGTAGRPMTVHLATAGRHNAANALAVAAAANALGLGAEDIVRGLTTFTGVGRRLERSGEAAGVVVYDDYAHHPTAIRETLRAIRQREPGRPVWAVYEPLTFHRTAALLDPFADALAEADAVAVADIWAGRDPDTTIASARRAWRTRSSRVARTSPPSRRAVSRRPPRGWPARCGPATSSWSWAAATATGSGRCCSKRSPRRGDHDDRSRHGCGPARAPGGGSDRIRWRRLDGPLHGRHRSCSVIRPIRRSSGTTRVRADLLAASATEEQVAFTWERHWVVPPTILAPWRMSYVDRSSRARVSLAGFATLEVAPDGRIARSRWWFFRHETPTTR